MDHAADVGEAAARSDGSAPGRSAGGPGGACTSTAAARPSHGSKRKTLRALAQLSEHSPLLADLEPHLLARAAEVRRDLERKARRTRRRPEF
jgi:hypothetical protein